ncbi:MAG: SufD family Fe-S cluster assembly protein [Selenomonadaceae bacterium]|nr:SufD family Fe-S cluster assembly protein [Selenomonadaceae bacterium]
MNTFTEIPMRTWNWLGVNEVKNDVKAEIETFSVAANETKKFNQINLSKCKSAKKLHIKVEANAQLELTIVNLSENDSASEIVIDLEGDDSKVDIVAAYFGSADNKLDLNYIVHQRGKRTETNMFVSGALSGNCDKIFRGTLDFVKGSKGSVGREREEVIILSDAVRNRSVPLMLSGEDEVDGHHAVSVGRIDEDKLFYLMSRGLDRLEAEKLIVEAMFNPILERLDDDKLIGEISEIIERRLTDVK